MIIFRYGYGTNRKVPNDKHIYNNEYDKII